LLCNSLRGCIQVNEILELCILLEQKLILEQN
jgi:hypothetical protein